LYKCILWGGYAAGNSGDELTLAVALKDMQARYDGSVAILSKQPGYTMQQFSEAAVIPYELVPPADRSSTLRRLSRKLDWQVLGRPRWRYRVADQLKAEHPHNWVQHIQSGRMLYLVGGGYLTDLFDCESFLLPVLVAKQAGVPVATAPLGIGPFRLDEAARKVVEALTGSDLRVRDRPSLTFCARYQVPAELAKDDGFRAMEVIGLKPKSSNRGARKPRIGINIFDQHGNEELARTRTWWTDLLKALSRAPVAIQTFCFHTNPFLDFSRAMECCRNAGLASAIVRQPRLDFRAACAQLMAFDVIVSARFHAVVIGNLLGKATFAVYDGAYYASKMKAATEGFDRSKALSPSAMSPSDAAKLILAAASVNDQVRAVGK